MVDVGGPSDADVAAWRKRMTTITDPRKLAQERRLILEARQREPISAEEYADVLQQFELCNALDAALDERDEENKQHAIFTAAMSERYDALLASSTTNSERLARLQAENERLQEVISTAISRWPYPHNVPEWLRAALKENHGKQ